MFIVVFAPSAPLCGHGYDPLVILREAKDLWNRDAANNRDASASLSMTDEREYRECASGTVSFAR
jgi:hypothetical protein